MELRNVQFSSSTVMKLPRPGSRTTKASSATKIPTVRGLAIIIDTCMMCEYHINVKSAARGPSLFTLSRIFPTFTVRLVIFSKIIIGRNAPTPFRHKLMLTTMLAPTAGPLATPNPCVRPPGITWNYQPSQSPGFLANFIRPCNKSPAISKPRAPT